MTTSTSYCHDRALIDQLIHGQVDFIEAGDSRIPGQPHSLRAIASGDAERPLALYEGDKVPRPETTRKATVEEALSILSERRTISSQTIGPCSRIFTLKLRKRSAEA